METSTFKLIGFGVMLALGVGPISTQSPAALVGWIVLIASPWLLIEALVLWFKESAADRRQREAEEARRLRVEQVMNQAPYGQPTTPDPPPFTPHMQARPVVRGSTSTLRRQRDLFSLHLLESPP